MIGAKYLTQFPGEGSKVRSRIPFLCFWEHPKLQAKEPQMFANDTIGLLEPRLFSTAWAAGSVVGLLQTTAFVFGGAFFRS